MQEVDKYINISKEQKSSDTANLSDSYNDGDNSSNNSFFCTEGVKKCKNEALKTALRTLILERGMSEPEFFHSIGLTRQYWYRVSWGLDEIPAYLKIKIAQALDVDSSVIFSVNRKTELNSGDEE